jgi:16S rRNA C967 or C1407 C5-methylase (RsmB/RsmF family)
MSSVNQLPDKFKERMAILLDQSQYDNYLSHFDEQQPVYFVLNPLKNSPDQTLEILSTLDLDLSPHPDIPKLGHLVWSVPASQKERLTYHDIHSDGFLYFIGLPSILTIAALEPEKHETILDLTAAPGGKTFLMALLMENSGSLIAVDQSKQRFFKMKANLDRLGVTNTSTRIMDGRRLPKTYMTSFDRVLLDAPCSCESRFKPDVPNTLKYWHVNKIKASVNTQKQLILNAFRALKPQGKLVYSTCTFAPEENEGVVAYLIKKHPESLIGNIPINIGLPGITNWNKQIFSEGQKTIRILPNHNHTGGCMTLIMAP